MEAELGCFPRLSIISASRFRLPLRRTRSEPHWACHKPASLKCQRLLCFAAKSSSAFPQIRTQSKSNRRAGTSVRTARDVVQTVDDVECSSEDDLQLQTVEASNDTAVESADAVKQNSNSPPKKCFREDYRRYYAIYQEASMTMSLLAAPGWKNQCVLQDTPTDPPLNFYDEFLPNHAVHIARVGCVHILRIRLSIGNETEASIDGVSSVLVTLPDAEARELKFEAVQQPDGSLEVLALFDPSSLGSEELKKISPSFGMIERKYSMLEGLVKAQLKGDAPEKLDFCRRLYIKLVSPKSKLRLHRWVGMFDHLKEST